MGPFLGNLAVALCNVSVLYSFFFWLGNYGELLTILRKFDQNTINNLNAKRVNNVKHKERLVSHHWVCCLIACNDSFINWNNVLLDFVMLWYSVKTVCLTDHSIIQR